MPAAPSGTTASHAPLDMGVRIRLSIMMFLQYFVWGAWFVTLGTFILSNTGDKGSKIFLEGFIGVAYGTAAIGGMIAPFFVGMIADRFFSSERILAVLHLAGAGVLYYLSTLTDQRLIYGVLIGYFVCYMPTLALTNSLSFHHLPDPGRQFPGIRVLGTFGWIIAGWLIGRHVRLLDGALAFVTDGTRGTSIEPTTYPMVIAAAAQALLAVYCLLLPHTPPPRRGTAVTFRDILGLDALRLLKRPAFAVFVIGSFLIAIPLQFYYNYTNAFLNAIGVQNAADKMTWGQISEVFFMLLMPLFFARLGVKYMLLTGMACWTARYALFAYGDSGPGMWMLYLGILLHGICYDFFFVTGQMYVDREADPSIRGAAQGFIAFVTLGVGSFIGANLSGYVQTRVTTGGVMDWRQFWLMPAAGAAVVLVLFAVSFFDGTDTKRTDAKKA
jgi:nucleoside transporter